MHTPALRRYLVALIAGILGVAVSFALFYGALNLEEEDERRRFEGQAGDVASALQREVDGAIVSVGALQTYFSASEQVGREEFATFASGLLGMHGVTVLSYNPLVPAVQRPVYEITAWEGGMPSFQFSERIADGTTVTAGRRDDYVIAWYIEPFAANVPALGYDVASDPARAAAIERARDTGLPAATERIQLVQETDDAYGVLIFAPVYADGATPSSIDERRAAFRGVVAAGVRMPDLIASAVAGGTGEINVTAFDGTDSDAAPFLASSESPDEGASTGRTIDVAGRTWWLVVRDADGGSMFSPFSRSTLVLVTGLLLSALLCLFLIASRRRLDETERAVLWRTAELVDANESLKAEIAARERGEASLAAHEQRFRALMERSADVLMELRDGIVTYVTPNFDTALGASVESLVGHSFAEFIHTEDLAGLSHYFQAGWTGSIDATFRTGPPGGPWGWREAKGVRLTDADGTSHAIVVIRNIDAQRGAGAALKESENRARAMLAAIPDMIFSVDRSGVYLDLKAAPDEEADAPLGQHAGRTIHEAVPKELADQAMAAIERAITTRRPQSMEYTLISPEGTGRTYEARMSATGADEVIVIVRNITDQRSSVEVRRGADVSGRVRLRSLIVTVVEGLRPTLEKTQAAVRILGHLPEVAGDAPTMENILGSLMATCLKHNSNARPQIELGVRNGEAGMATLYIRDNGTQIDPRDLERVLGTGEQSQGGDKFDGARAALVAVKAAIESAGGRIWVEPETGAGIKFVFTLPLWIQREIEESAA